MIRLKIERREEDKREKKAGKTVEAASRLYSCLNQRVMRRAGNLIARTEAAICSRPPQKT